MATLAQITDFAVGQPALFTRFKAGRLQAAWDILPENSGANLAIRQAWARKVLGDYDKDDAKEYRWFLSHSLVQATGAAITDANLVIAVKSFVDVWAA